MTAFKKMHVLVADSKSDTKKIQLNLNLYPKNVLKVKNSTIRFQTWHDWSTIFEKVIISLSCLPKNQIGHKEI